jgi:hypothetical protein
MLKLAYQRRLDKDTEAISNEGDFLDAIKDHRDDLAEHVKKLHKDATSDFAQDKKLDDIASDLTQIDTDLRNIDDDLEKECKVLADPASRKGATDLLPRMKRLRLNRSSQRSKGASRLRNQA